MITLIDLSNELHRLMVKTLKSTAGMKQIILTDATGLIISKATKMSKNPKVITMDFEGIAAISTAIYLGLDSGEINLGKIGFSVTEFSYGKFCMLGFSKEHVITSIISRNSSLTKVRSSLMRLSKEISKTLELLKTSHSILKPKDKNIQVKNEKDSFDKVLDELSF